MLQQARIQVVKYCYSDAEPKEVGFEDIFKWTITGREVGGIVSTVTLNQIMILPEKALVAIRQDLQNQTQDHQSHIDTLHNQYHLSAKFV